MCISCPLRVRCNSKYFPVIEVNGGGEIVEDDREDRKRGRIVRRVLVRFKNGGEGEVNIILCVAKYSVGNI